VKILATPTAPLGQVSSSSKRALATLSLPAGHEVKFGVIVLSVRNLGVVVTRDGTAVEVEIYGDGKGAWLLEVVDEFGNSTVWDDSFTTDSAALVEALNVIDSEGIAAVIGSPPVSATRH
jgi:hypothetical protein